jgi:hypothetical protein
MSERPLAAWGGREAEAACRKVRAAELELHCWEAGGEIRLVGLFDRLFSVFVLLPCFRFSLRSCPTIRISCMCCWFCVRDHVHPWIQPWIYLIHFFNLIILFCGKKISYHACVLYLCGGNNFVQAHASIGTQHRESHRHPNDLSMNLCVSFC